MKQCARCRQPKPLHALFRIHGGEQRQVYYCGPCRDRWLEAEGRAAIVLERGQAANAGRTAR